MFKSVFVALMGSPNAGKSTLLNALTGRKVAIVSKKPQTTRSRISGILTTAEYQMVFIDTPGIHSPKNKLGEFMVKTAESAANDVDVVVFVVDAKPGARERDLGLIGSLPDDLPVILALNKVDAVDEARIEEVEGQINGFGRKIMRISALNGSGVPELKEELMRYMSEGPMFYPEDMTSDQTEAMIAAELIREKALKGIGKEIPHGIGVDVEKFEYDEKKLIYNIDAVIYCERDSHKGIIIGAGGKMLKKIASAAREDMEQMLGSKVFLKVFVKVKPDWRNKGSVLRTLGYTDV